MNLRYVIGIIALAGVSVCGLTASLVGSEMVDKVNGLLPAEQQFAPLGWYWSKYRRLKNEYKRLYPAGNLLRMQRALTLVMFACLLISCWGFGFFVR